MVEGGTVLAERADERVPSPRGARGGAPRRLAELLALTAFAIAQPVLDVTGRSPDFFLYRRPTPGDLRLRGLPLGRPGVAALSTDDGAAPHPIRWAGP